MSASLQNARLYRVYLLHLLCSGTFVPGTEFRELNFLLVVPWKVFPEQIIVEVLGPQRAYRPEISRQGCLQGCGCGGRRQYYCFRFTMNHVIHPIETPECYIYEQRDSICGVGVYHTFLVVWPLWSEILWWKTNSCYPYGTICGSIKSNYMQKERKSRRFWCLYF